VASQLIKRSRLGTFLPLLIILTSLLGWGRALQAQESVRPTPTVDRLGPPPTVPSPTQADEGAYLYWLNCQPCHGDQGQGLTDEWRAQYPEEDQYCWNSGCHGERPYEDGFKLPRTVPAVIGDDSLRRFQTAGQMYAYIRVTMPYEYPGVLPEEEYLAIAAFLLRENNLGDGAPLTQESVNHLALWPDETTPLLAATAITAATPIPLPAAPAKPNSPFSSVLVAGLTGAVVLLGGIWIWRRKAQ
jgi:mono/diheme cytochrome c family protein